MTCRRLLTTVALCALRAHGNSRYPQNNVAIEHSMYACLNVDEIVRLIARELVMSGGKATAVALACCCKSLEDPVLDTLWVAQDQLLPLLRSFPRDVWNRRGSLSFKRLPTIIEWARFRKYARRMRKLTEFQWRLNSLSEPLSILQLCTNNGVLFPNLKTLALLGIQGSVVPFIPLFLSLRTTSITLNFWNTDLPNAAVASVITTIPTLCPELQMICLCHLPRDPMITAAVSGMLLATNRDTLQHFYVDSPLTEEASEVVYKLPNLCDLSVVIEKETSLPEASLPNLTEITIKCEDEGDWPRLFYGASLGKLETVTFCPQSEKIGDFLGAFERAALSSSLQNTLSKFSLEPGCSWNPNYSSLLPFTQLVELNIGFSCDGGCSSRVDDNIVINLSRKMPGLRALQLGCDPCREFTIGVTAEGLMALALHCPDLRLLCIHFQVDSLTAPPASPGMSPNAKPTDSWTDCALTELVVGKIPAPESALMVTLALLRIFPRIEAIASDDEGWQEVEDAIRLSKQIVDCSRAKLKISER